MNDPFFLAQRRFGDAGVESPCSRTLPLFRPDPKVALMLAAGFADPAPDAARAFRAIMQAMACPGTRQAVASLAPPKGLSPAAAAVVLVLFDRGTPVHLCHGHDTQAIRDWITFHTGAPFAPAELAAFALGRWQAMPHERLAIGTPEYPDRSATLVIEVESLDGVSTLTGPGIRDSATMYIPDPAVFAANHARFPLGWDAILTCGEQIAAVPRSTEVR